VSDVSLEELLKELEKIVKNLENWDVEMQEECRGVSWQTGDLTTDFVNTRLEWILDHNPWLKEWLQERIKEMRNFIPKFEAFMAGLRKLRNDLDKTFDDEVELVRKVCLNVLKQPMYGEKLQKVVIYHMKNYKAKLDRRLDAQLGDLEK